MSLFGQSTESTADGYQTEGEQDDHDGEGIVEIEYVGQKRSQTLSQQGGASVKKHEVNETSPEYIKEKSKLVKPMGNEEQIEENLLEQTAIMNDSKNGEIIQPSQYQIQITVKNQTTAAPKKIEFYQVKETCPFEKCHLDDMKGKKWASVEDAGILLCTKAP